MSFVEREITITFQLGKGSFGESGFNTVNLAGYRCSVEIDRAALPYQGQATARIYGLTPSIMNRLSTLGGSPGFSGRLNLMTISAGDAVGGMFQIFEGIITNGYQDYGSMPEVSFVAEAAVSALDLLKPSGATSYSGNADVATILSGMASRMTPPLSFQNFGVTMNLPQAYFYGCLLDQIRSVIIAANINGEIINGTLYIWPRNSPRPTPPITISPTNGLVGYPSINGVQVFDLRVRFNPTLDLGATIDIQSSLQPACGNWYLLSATHLLDSKTPGGAWFTDIQACSKDYITSLPAS